MCAVTRLACPMCGSVIEHHQLFGVGCELCARALSEPSQAQRDAARVAVDERWLDKGCKRIATVVAVERERVSYRYAQGGQNGLWRRGVTPVQTIPLADWLRRFKPAR